MSGSVLLPDCCRTLGKDHALAAAGGQLATRPNHTFQFLPQLLNAVSPVVVLEEISVLQVCDLAQHPKIELLPVKANDLGADLVEAIHLDTFSEEVGFLWCRDMGELCCGM